MSVDQVLHIYLTIVIGACLVVGLMALVVHYMPALDGLIERLEAAEIERKSKPLCCRVWGR